MFVYEDGVPVGYRSEEMRRYPTEVQNAIEVEMLRWYATLGSQSRQRLGKRDIYQGNSAPDLRRMEDVQSSEL